MTPPAPAPSLPRYVVRLSDALTALLGGAEDADINNEGGELSEEKVLDGLRAAGLITYPPPPATEHPVPATDADPAAAQPLPAAADDDGGAPWLRVVRLAGAIAALLGHAEGAEVTEDEARG